jgi:hypothetical protein
VDIDRIKEAVRGVKRDVEINSRVVHINVQQCTTYGWEFTMPEYVFASKYVNDWCTSAPRVGWMTTRGGSSSTAGTGHELNMWEIDTIADIFR